MDESVCDVCVLSDLKVISRTSSTPYTSEGAVVTEYHEYEEGDMPKRGIQQAKGAS